jgi:predicted ATPase
MPFEPIKQLDIENYGCIKKASFALTPLHALIGPNDSGKSTTLRALRTLALFAAEDQGKVENGFEPMWGRKSDMRLVFVGGATYKAFTSEDDPASIVTEYRRENLAFGFRGATQTRNQSIKGIEVSPEVLDLLLSVWRRLSRATMVRFDPNALRAPSGQILADKPIQFFDEIGMGLASVYQAINSRDVDAFVDIRNEVKAYFPTVQNILVPNIGTNQVVLQVRLIDNTLVPAEALSEGLLYFLGFMALQHLTETRLFLVEEPENGLHPARIAEVMAILREISKTSQVIIATHSPLVVNELKGDEVSILTRDPEKGTQVTLLKDVPGYEDAMKVYQPGEFWVSYCDGKQEAPLLTGRPRS